MRASSIVWIGATLGMGWPSSTRADDGPDGSGSIKTVDLSAAGRARGDYISRDAPQPQFDRLDEFAAEGAASPVAAGTDAQALEARVIPDPDLKQPDDSTAIFAVEDIPGNKYPRKHTLFLNFTGADMISAADNSAENTSRILRQSGFWPPFIGGETQALAIAQSIESDVAAYGIRVAYYERPRNLVPYTMVMFGGSWTMTTATDPASGVAVSDCGALGQRHVVYTFGTGDNASRTAKVASQEAGHAWGLDHTRNCNSVMAYCFTGEAGYSQTCDDVCPECQADLPVSCGATHEMFCPEGQQNDHAELSWLFGTNEPDVEPPTVEIVEPPDGLAVDVGGEVQLRTVLDDNYGGFGWKYVIRKDGVLIYDRPDYERDVDDEYRAAINLQGLEYGFYELTVEVEDQADHVAVATATVSVGGAPPFEPPGTDTGLDSGADGSADGQPGSSGADGGDDDSGGCRIATPGGRRAPPWAIAVFALGLWRRRAAVGG